MRITDKRDILYCVAFFLSTLISRIFLVEKFQSHWDGPQYSIAIFRYSIADYTPASPGYPIYIGIGKFINLLVQNPHASLIVESVFFNALGAVVMYLFAKQVFGQKTAVIAAILYITSPVIYFFSLTAYAYGVDVFFYLIFACASYMVIIRRWGRGMYVGIAYGLLIGFRPQDIFFTLPLLLFAFLTLEKKQKRKMIWGVIATSLIWGIPLLLSAGGLINYTQYMLNAGGSMINVSRYNLFAVVNTLLKGLVLTLGFASVFPILFLITNVSNWRKIKINREIYFFVLWMLPPFLFNLFIRSDHAGYQLSYLIPLMMLCAACVVSLFKKSRYLKLFIIGIALINCVIFFRNRDVDQVEPYVPTSFHYSEIRKNDKKMEEKTEYIRGNYTPDKTLIVVGGADYFRPVMYYFPDFKVIQINKLTAKDKQYQNLIREGFAYNMKEYKSTKNFYNIPTGITSVLCFDDECLKWAAGNKKAISFNQSTSVVEMSGKIQKLEYDFNKIRLE